ncbi:MAG: hypothetical protein GDA46_00945 [Bdellovibrionales bacterium]|nr:hypothetical protein [Bdellovibrionales bacterium]
MNCPVCQNSFPQEILKMEEFYYDCSTCHSALYFNEGKIEIISRGEEFEEKKDQKEKSKDISFQENPQKEEDNLEESFLQESRDFVKSNSVEETSFNKEQSFKPQEIETVPEIESSFDEREEEMENEESFHENEVEMENEESFHENEVEEMENEESFHKNEVEETKNEESFAFSEEDNIEEKPEDFSEVQEFSKKREFKDKGFYLYQLFLSEINSQELKERVISIIEDKALEIDFEENPSYKKQIVYNGKIVFSRLSPVQVYVIVHSLMGLPLQIHWKQSHVTDF